MADARGNCAAIEFDLFDGWKTMITLKLRDWYDYSTTHEFTVK